MITFGEKILLVKHVLREPPQVWKFPRWSNKAQKADKAFVKRMLDKFYKVTATPEQLHFLKTLERASGMHAIYAVQLTKLQYTHLVGYKSPGTENRFFTFQELESSPEFREKDRDLIRSLSTVQ